MATASEIAAAKALGFTAPTGSDMIRDGDNAITENAAVAVRELNRRPLFAQALQYGKKWNSSDDLNSWWQHGAWGVTGAQGMPPGVSSATMIQIEAGNGAWQRLWISFGVDAGIWLQWGNQVAGVWHPPTRLDTSNNLDPALAHELRVQDLQRRRARTTTAKGVVVFVLDHGYSAFMEKCWPDLQARGFPVTWALNTVHPAAIDTGDAGLDWSAIKTLAAAHPNHLEIAAHSANHGNVTDRQNLLEDAIVEHRTELETLTGQRVDSWIQPGATLGSFVKDNPGSPDDYANTRAGRLIAANYAAATGYIASPRTFKLDGRPDLGIVGNWIDAGPGSIMTYVNGVATNGGYTLVRMHPQYLDEAGYITRAQWQGVLDQIKTLVDAGTVEVMTLRDASVTTNSTTHTHTRLDTANASLLLDSAGGVQHHVGGARKFRIDSSGTMIEGSVPIERIPGLAASLYDSGLRNVASLFGLASGVAYLHVKSGLVWLNFNNAVLNGSGSVVLTAGDLATVAPSAPVASAVGNLITGSNLARRLEVNRYGQVRVLGYSGTEVLNGSLTWPMTRTPPAIPPGDPA